MDAPTLPKTERRRKYFQVTVEELQLLLKIDKQQATVTAERIILFLQAKVKHEDPINFGVGLFSPKILRPRSFNMIVGSGPEHRKVGFCGRRVSWKLKLFKRARKD